MQKMKGIEFAESVLLRPSMYTLKGSYEEAICFLEGYFSGLSHSSAHHEYADEWSALKRWLALEFRVDSSEIWKLIADQYQDEAVAMVRQKMKQFKNSSG